MTSTVILNSTNVVPNSNNSKFVYKFDKAQSFKNSEIALSSIQLYYSWYNINSFLYNNNTFQYRWFNSSGVLNQTITVVIPDGFYDINSLNTYFQGVLLQNGHYTTVGNLNTFYFELVENPTYYAIQLNVIPVPALGSTNPTRGSTSWQYPTVATTPQFIVLSTNNFKNIIGYNAISYPETPSSIQQKFLSQNCPVITPVSSVAVRCNLAKNVLSNPSDFLYCFTQGMSGFGDLIDIHPSNLNWTSINDGNFTELVVSFTDQNFNPIRLIDNQLIIVLLIRQV